MTYPSLSQLCAIRRKLLGGEPSHSSCGSHLVDRILRTDIEAGAVDGAISVPLYTLMRLVACEWSGGMQEVEGINSIVQKVASRAPRISLALLDARVAARKYLGICRFALQTDRLPNNSHRMHLDRFSACPACCRPIGTSPRLLGPARLSQNKFYFPPPPVSPVE